MLSSPIKDLETRPSWFSCTSCRPSRTVLRTNYRFKSRCTCYYYARYSRPWKRAAFVRGRGRETRGLPMHIHTELIKRLFPENLLLRTSRRRVCSRTLQLRPILRTRTRGYWFFFFPTTFWNTINRSIIQQTCLTILFFFHPQWCVLSHYRYYLAVPPRSDAMNCTRISIAGIG